MSNNIFYESVKELTESSVLNVNDLKLHDVKTHDLIIFQMDDNLIYLLMKRVIDILGSIIGLILFSPLILVISIFIKIEDHDGSVIFCQKRCGKNGKQFTMFKFRSMVEHAEELVDDLKYMNEMSGPVFKIEKDPRVTKIGRFIRKRSIDEIPQFLNVLKGDMSLVGPRPPLPNEVEEYSLYEMQRLLVKPGLTCIWQVSGRNNIDFDDWVELDLEYIRERNFWIDLKLILMTVPALLGNEGAH